MTRNLLLFSVTFLLSGVVMAKPSYISVSQEFKKADERIVNKDWYILDGLELKKVKVYLKKTTGNTTTLGIKSDWGRNLYCSPHLREGKIVKIDEKDQCWSTDNIRKEFGKKKSKQLTCKVDWKKSNLELKMTDYEIVYTEAEISTVKLSITSDGKTIDAGRVQSIDLFDFDGDEKADVQWFLDYGEAEPYIGLYLSSGDEGCLGDSELLHD